MRRQWLRGCHSAGPNAGWLGIQRGAASGAHGRWVPETVLYGRLEFSSPLSDAMTRFPSAPTDIKFSANTRDFTSNVSVHLGFASQVFCRIF
jgi:hypothetical protein